MVAAHSNTYKINRWIFVCMKMKGEMLVIYREAKITHCIFRCLQNKDIRNVHLQEVIPLTPDFL